MDIFICLKEVKKYSRNLLMYTLVHKYPHQIGIDPINREHFWAYINSSVWALNGERVIILTNPSVEVKVYSIQLGNYFPIPGYNKLDTGKQMSNTTSVEKVYATFSWSLTVFQYI